MTEFPLTGGCNGRAVQFEVTAPLLVASYRHCRRCQRRSGAAASANAHPEPDTFHIVAGEDRLRVRKPDDDGEKWFCGSCGSSLFGRNPNHARSETMNCPATPRVATKAQTVSPEALDPPRASRARGKLDPERESPMHAGAKVTLNLPPAIRLSRSRRFDSQEPTALGPPRLLNASLSIASRSVPKGTRSPPGARSAGAAGPAGDRRWRPAQEQRSGGDRPRCQRASETPRSVVTSAPSGSAPPSWCMNQTRAPRNRRASLILL